jgi:branched-chain amino acid transport system ATP-binding protein
MLVEQNVEVTLNLADRAYVLSRGALVLSGTAEELRSSDRVRSAYLGMGN